MFISLRGLAAAGHNGAVTFKGLPGDIARAAAGREPQRRARPPLRCRLRGWGLRRRSSGTAGSGGRRRRWTFDARQRSAQFSSGNVAGAPLGGGRLGRDLRLQFGAGIGQQDLPAGSGAQRHPAAHPVANLSCRAREEPVNEYLLPPMPSWLPHGDSGNVTVAGLRGIIRSGGPSGPPLFG